MNATQKAEDIHSVEETIVATIPIHVITKLMDKKCEKFKNFIQLDKNSKINYFK